MFVIQVTGRLMYWPSFATHLASGQVITFSSAKERPKLATYPVGLSGSSSFFMGEKHPARICRRYKVRSAGPNDPTSHLGVRRVLTPPDLAWWQIQMSGISVAHTRSPCQTLAASPAMVIRACVLRPRGRLVLNCEMAEFNCEVNMPTVRNNGWHVAMCCVLK